MDLFSDDFTCDIRDDFIKYISQGKSSEDATELLKKEHLPLLGDDEYPIFWIALAAIQWEKGRLIDEVKNEALIAINSGGDLSRWEDSSSNYKKRAKVLDDVKSTILSPMPPMKKISTSSIVQSDPWDVGDLFTYKIIREKIPYKQYIGTFILLRVVEMAFYQADETYYANYAAYAWNGRERPNPQYVTKLPFLKLYEANIGTSGYFYQIACNLELAEDSAQKRSFERIKSDGTYSPIGNKLLTNGKVRGTMNGDAFDVLVSKALHNANL